MNLEPELVAQFPYLDLTEADLQMLLDSDPVTQKGRAAVQSFREKIADYEQRRSGYRVELDRLADERSELEARLKANDTQTRDVRGADAGMRYHVQLAERRITEREVALRRRTKFLFRAEVNRRLARMGKEFRLTRGASDQA